MEEEETAADVLVERLITWVGVDTIFGIPGDGISSVIEAPCDKKKFAG